MALLIGKLRCDDGYASIAAAGVTRWKGAAGSCVYMGTAARVQGPGDPLQYPGGPEYRDAAALQEMCAQLPGKPVTLLHPDGILAEGARGHVIGRVLAATLDADGDEAEVIFEITDPAGDSAIAGGTQELSVGYECALDAGRYQRGIAVDHLAVVPRARCGPACHIDAAPPRDCGCGCGGTCKTRAMPHNHGDMSTPLPEPTLSSIPSEMQLSGTHMLDSDLTAKARHALPGKHFAIPAREGLPIEDEGHVRAAMARFSQTDFTSSGERRAAYHRIVARAHELGIDPSDFQKKHGAHMDNAPGGGEGIAQAPLDPGFPAPDIHAKLAGLQADLAAMTAKYDAEKAAHGITMARQLEAEKSRDEGSQTAMEFKKKADEMQEKYDALAKERDQYKAQLDAMRDDRDSARKDAESATKRADAADETARRATDKARLDADTEFQARVATRAAARADLLTKANAVLGVADRAKMTDRDIMCAVVKQVHSVDIASAESNDYVRARFDAALERHFEVVDSKLGTREALQQIREGADAHNQTTATGLAGEKAAQAEMTARASTAWVAKK